MISIQSTYYYLKRLPLPNVCPILLANKSIWITKTVGFKREFFDTFSVNATSKGIVIVLVLIGYSNGSNYSLEHRLNSNRKSVSLSTIGVTLK